MFWKNIKMNKGFTMVETLVAIGILSIAILGTYTAVQSGLQKSTMAKDEIVAFYLAQEAVEYVKNIRDENSLAGLSGTSVNWLAGLSAQASDNCYFGKVCTIDSPLKTTSHCTSGAGNCPNLRMDSNTGLWGYTGSWALTNFKREIQFQSISANEVRVNVAVYWTSRGSTKSFQVSEIIFNHQ